MVLFAYQNNNYTENDSFKPVIDILLNWHTCTSIARVEKKFRGSFSALGFFAVGRRTFAVRKKNPTEHNLTETNIFPYGELSHGRVSYGEKCAHGQSLLTVDVSLFNSGRNWRHHASKWFCPKSFIQEVLTHANFCDVVHAEKYFPNLIQSYRNQIVVTIFWLIWIQTDVRLVANQSENYKYNLISV